ncbi:DsbA family protein [Deinococcus maricopensis]|uniref:DSBA oxidoreductase n=1 Tax=Deinococcus maricopensis (strain DSM 21211 / LMG 22137 / NRRL B-23946 / LB-34) TaxID=709986 RepID=E8U8K9_DEIML|nr:thioredoxin domain-containing protein [Deinococcus maricopensis]ADV67398.1 DSBA oxidoreductase [Deinococcus maricopensis DSM 21211]
MSKPNLQRDGGSNANRMALLIGTVIAAVLIALALFTRHGNGNTQAQTFDLTGRPVLGRADAPVTMIVFEDYKCPVCKGFDEEDLPTLKSKYIDTGKVKMVAMAYPFLAQNFGLSDDDSTRASVAAKCMARQGTEKFWAYHHALFRGQQDEKTVWATEEALQDLAGTIDGVDTAAFNTCLKDQATLKEVNDDKAQGDKAGVNGTPSVYVNGRYIANFHADALGQAIEDAQK